MLTRRAYTSEIHSKNRSREQYTLVVTIAHTAHERDLEKKSPLRVVYTMRLAPPEAQTSFATAVVLYKEIRLEAQTVI